jgi:hypothetical protein
MLVTFLIVVAIVVVAWKLREKRHDKDKDPRDLLKG